MRIYCLLFLAVVMVSSNGCQPAALSPVGDDAAAGFRTTSSIGEIMDAMVMPAADVLWAAGIEEDAPKTQDGWTKVRRNAVTLLEASDLLVMPGRHAVKPGDNTPTPSTQLTPEQIDALIVKDRASWTEFSHKMHDVAMAAVKAADEKSVKGLMEVGDSLTAACGDCHKKFWYPNEK